METLAFALGRHPLSCVQWESQGRSTRANERGLEGCRAVLMDLGIISALFGSNGFQYIASQIPGFAGWALIVGTIESGSCGRRSKHPRHHGGLAIFLIS